MLLARNAELDCEAPVDGFCELPPRSSESPDQPRGALPLACDHLTRHLPPASLWFGATFTLSPLGACGSAAEGDGGCWPSDLCFGPQSALGTVRP